MARISRIILVICLVLPLLASVASAVRQDNRGKREKARYYYLKGAVSEAEGKQDEAYEYYRKAYRTDTTYDDAAFAYAFNRLGIDEDTLNSLPEVRRSLWLMKQLLDNNPRDIESAQRYAYAASLADTIEEALRVYRVLQNELPGQAQIYAPLSYYHMAVGNVDSAVMAIREFERLKGSSTETILRKISYLMTADDTVASLAEVRRYVEENPGNPQTVIDRARLYHLLGQPDSAILFLEDAIREHPANKEMRLDIALMYAERGDSAKFYSLVEDVFKEPDTEYEERMQILDILSGRTSKGKKENPEADRLFEYAATLYPEDADFFDQYADYEAGKRNFGKAYEYEKISLGLAPSEVYFLNRLLSFSFLADRQKEGMTAFENFPNPERSHEYGTTILYVTAAQSVGEYDKALTWLDTIIAREAPGITLQTELEENSRDSLTAQYGQQTVGRLSIAFEIAGDINAKLGRKDDAVRGYENSVTLDSDNNPSALNNYAYYIVETLKAPAGSELLEKAKNMSYKSLQQSGANPEDTYLDTYAWILYKEGNYEDALLYQEMAIEAAGDGLSEEHLSHYGDILYKLDRGEEALEQWEKALLLNPDNPELKQKIKDCKDRLSDSGVSRKKED